MDYDLKWNVLNYDFNRKKVEPFNIFQNYYVYEGTIKLVKKVRRMSEKTCQEKYSCSKREYLVKELDRIIMWQEWSRAEYEMGVCYLFEEDVKKIKRTDCYEQAHMNIELIADYVWRVIKK